MPFSLPFWISDEEPGYSEWLQLLQEDNKPQPHQQHARECLGPLGLDTRTPRLFQCLHRAGLREKIVLSTFQFPGNIGEFHPLFINRVSSSCFYQLDIENEVNNEMANRMSLFYAEATPMLKTLSNATMNFVSEVSGLEQWGAFSLIAGKGCWQS